MSRPNRNNEMLENEAVSLLDRGKLRSSERLLKRMLAINTKCLPAHFHLARVYRRTGQYDLALYHARRTLRLSPDEPNASLNLGLIYDLMGRDTQAIRCYKKELSRNPDSAETLWNIGRTYFRKHRWLQASVYLRRCFRLRFMHQFEDTVDKLGICYYKLGDLRSYIEVFKTYVQMFPRAAWAFANLGRALLSAKDYRGAVLRLSRARQLGNKKVARELEHAKELFKKKRKSRV